MNRNGIIRWSIVVLLVIISILFLFRVGSVLVPFIFAWIFAYLLNPLVNLLERKGISRVKGIVFIYGVLISVIAVLCINMFPKLVNEVNSLGTVIPLYTEKIQGVLDQIEKQYSRFALPESINLAVNQGVERVEQIILDTLNNAINAVIGLLTNILDVVLIPILAFYFLKDKELIKEQFWNFIPSGVKKELFRLFKDMDDVLKGFLTGSLTVGVLVGVLTTLGLTFVHMDFALVFGILAGLFNVIPYFGPLFGMVPAVLIALMDSTNLAIIVFFIMLAVQQIESNFITPKIMGEKIGVHPVIIIFALLAGGSLFGIVGMVLAAPMAGIIRVLLRFIVKKTIALK